MSLLLSENSHQHTKISEEPVGVCSRLMSLVFAIVQISSNVSAVHANKMICIICLAEPNRRTIFFFHISLVQQLLAFSALCLFTLPPTGGCGASAEGAEDVLPDLRWPLGPDARLWLRCFCGARPCCWSFDSLPVLIAVGFFFDCVVSGSDVRKSVVSSSVTENAKAHRIWSLIQSPISVDWNCMYYSRGGCWSGSLLSMSIEPAELLKG